MASIPEVTFVVPSQRRRSSFISTLLRPISTILRKHFLNVPRDSNERPKAPPPNTSISQPYGVDRDTIQPPDASPFPAIWEMDSPPYELYDPRPRMSYAETGSVTEYFVVDPKLRRREHTSPPPATSGEFPSEKDQQACSHSRSENKVDIPVPHGEATSSNKTSLSGSEDEALAQPTSGASVTASTTPATGSPVDNQAPLAKEPQSSIELPVANELPPITQLPLGSPAIYRPLKDHQNDAYDIEKPTCSLNLVCYRGGSEGCVLSQIHTAIASRFKDEEWGKKFIASDKNLIVDDRQFFQKLQQLYYRDMISLWRRRFSLKSLVSLRLLEYSPGRRPTVVPLDDFVLYPERAVLCDQTNWIQWVFGLRQRNKRHALEFVEGWNTTRIVIAGCIPWLVSCLVGIVWTAKGGDAQTAFTVASFILSSGTVMIALLAVVSGVETVGRGVAPKVTSWSERSPYMVDSSASVNKSPSSGNLQEQGLQRRCHNPA